MKSKATITILCLALSPLSGRTQVIVLDPTQVQQHEITHLEDLTKYAQMIQNQMQQITTLTHQLAELLFLSSVLGNPATNVSLPAITLLVASVNTPGPALSRPKIIAQSSPADAQVYDGQGLYHQIGQSFITLDGTVVPRQEEPYRPHAALIKAVTTQDEVDKDVAERRRSLREAMRDNLEQLRQSTTDAESQKLIGVAIGLAAERQAAGEDLALAAQRTAAQKTANKDDEKKQALARREEQAADIAEAMKRWTSILRPNNGPAQLNSASRD